MQRFAKFSLTSLVIFLLLSTVVSTGMLRELDRNFTSVIQSSLSSLVDLPLSVFSLIGMAEIASVILLISLYLFPILRSFITLVLYVLTGVIELAFKSVLEQVAPPLSILKTHSFFHFPSSSIPIEFFSYPSGHSARTAFISVLLLFAISRNTKVSNKLKYICFAFILIFDFLMFYSRIYLGEHWLTDVFGGALLGVFLAFSALYMLSWLYKSNK